MNEINITKSNGDKVPYSKEKITRSLKGSGARPEQIEKILEEVKNHLYEGITTKKIYRLAFNMLREGSRHLAARYHLKKAIMELGPSGFPFEIYFAEILNYQGYKTKVGEILKGKCINHEVDVIAEKDNSLFMVECKYHNQSGKFSDVQVPLYIQSRFKDLEAQWLNDPSHKNKTHKGWVVTNTRFSIDAINYGTCIGLNLLSWDYPLNTSLKIIIDSLGLYPITCLTSLTRVEKQRLLDRKIVLCKEILNDKHLLETSGVKDTRIHSVIKEAEQLCQHLIKYETAK
jgi:Holliday junction resolvase-like predicted endonuclease